MIISGFRVRVQGAGFSLGFRWVLGQGVLPLTNAYHWLMHNP